MRRHAYLAGSWYPADAAGCRGQVAEILAAAAPPGDLPETLYGGLVPHAGWGFSGATAAMTLKALADRGALKRVVIFGANHGRVRPGGAIFAEGSWATPLGDVPVDEALAAAIREACPKLSTDPGVHDGENSIEIQVPLLRALSEELAIVPIMLSPTADAVDVGRAAGELIAERFADATVIGSTDLTHYGPNYGFAPAGGGAAGLEWTRANDRRILDLIEQMQPEAVLREANDRHNACGGGAVAATIAACAARGATRGVTLAYTTSADIAPGPNAVGYASVVFAAG